MREKWRALKHAGALLGDDHVGSFRCELVINAIEFRNCGRQRHFPPRGNGAFRPIVWPSFLGAVKDGKGGSPHSRDQALGRLNSAMRIDAAAVRIALVQIDWAARAATI